ncbi:MAG TPA: thioesterase family protein [bacterium]|jgi:acyl-CoA thioester hydrolase
MKFHPVKLEDFSEEQKISVRVRYADTDRMGVVYHANYFAYFESGRAELIRRIWKPYLELEKEGIILPVVEAGCRYLQAAEYDDLLTVCTNVAEATGARLRFEYAIFKNDNGRPLARGYTVHCFMDLQGRPRRMPAELKGIFQVR